MLGWASNKAERAVGTGVFRALGAVLVAVVVVALLFPREPNLAYDRTWVWVGFVAWGTAWLVAVVAWRRFGRSRVVRWVARRSGVVAWALTGLGMAAALVVALNLGYRFGWDARVLVDLGSRLDQGAGGTGTGAGTGTGGTVPDYYYRYLSRYPNQVPFAALTKTSFQLGRALGWQETTVFAVLNAVCVGVTLQSVFVVVRRVRGALAALAAQVAGLALLAVSPWVAVPYTDVVTLPVPIAATALLLVAATRPSRVAAVTLGVVAVAVLSFGYVVKTTPVATVAGLLALGVLVLLSRLRDRRRAATAALVLLVSTGAFLGLSSGLRVALSDSTGLDLARVDTSLTPPLSWWLAMGLTRRAPSGLPRYGAYDPTMVTAIASMDGPQIDRYSRETLDHRLGALGPGGYAQFAADKVAWNLGDGMFWAWGEGLDGASVVPRHGPLTAWVVSWDHPAGDHYGVRAGLTQGLWLVVLLAAGAGLLVRPYRRDVALLVVSAVGIIVFTLVLQGRSRYLFVYAPVFIALAGAVVPVGRPAVPWHRSFHFLRSGAYAPRVEGGGDVRARTEPVRGSGGDRRLQGPWRSAPGGRGRGAVRAP
ncbi:hypothetical protein GCM10025782_36340 [Pedococcus ginsenosidimutans]|uniref:Glycosyltransferase RgtA/B/C/D-like domain-containing protein n=1 Tax=Pedococcus ginsenosidimutans TaxID=490570 RepID=A0ABP8YNE4_9MICO